MQQNSLILPYNFAGFDKCIQLYNYHYNQNIEQFHHPKKLSHAPL